MKVSYVTPFYNGKCDGRFGRFHDWVHALRDMDDPPFEFDIHTIMATNPDESLAAIPSSHLGDASELWGTKRNRVESVLEAPRIYRDLRAADADIVHLIAFDLLLLPSVIASFDNTPLVLGPNVAGWCPIREDDVWLTGPIESTKARAKYFLRKHVMRRLEYEHIVSFGDYHRQMLDFYDICSSDVTTLQPGVDGIFSPASNFESPSPPYNLLYVGSFSEHKGYPILLRAINQVKKDVHVTFVGSGDPDKNLIRSLNIENNISIEGFVERAELPSYYREADLFVLPSKDEMGANTQIEAYASGTPVVATDTDGISEFGYPDTTIRFWPRNPDSLAAAIDKAIENIDLLTERTTLHAQEFNVSNTVSQLSSIYKGLI